MTDKKDEIEIESQDESLLDQEEAFETEDWNDDLPPEDDFNDSEDFSLDENLLDEDLEVLHEEDPYEDESLDAAKKRGKNVFVAVIGVVILAVGGVVYMQFAPSESKNTKPITSLLSIQEVRKTPKLAAKKDQTDVAPKSRKIDMVSLYQSGNAGSDVELPIPTPSNKLRIKEDKEKKVLSAVLIETKGSLSPPMPTSISTPEKADIKKIEEIKIETNLQPKTKEKVDSSQNKTEVVIANNDKKLLDLKTQLDNLKLDLDKAKMENAKLISKIETMEKKIPAFNSDPEFQDKLKVLEGKLAEKEIELKKAKTQIVKKKSVYKKKRIYKRKKIVKKRWVLRGATVGSAWISPSSQSKELRNVKIGEKAPQIGMVKEIKQIGQKWLVIGTKGTIK